MIATLVIILLAVAGIFLFIKIITGDILKGGGGNTNVVFGATQELLTRDQRKAVEVISKKEAGDKEEEQLSGESVSLKISHEKFHPTIL